MNLKNDSSNNNNTETPPDRSLHQQYLAEYGSFFPLRRTPEKNLIGADKSDVQLMNDFIVKYQDLYNMVGVTTISPSCDIGTKRSRAAHLEEQSRRLCNIIKRKLKKNVPKRDLESRDTVAAAAGVKRDNKALTTVEVMHHHPTTTTSTSAAETKLSETNNNHSQFNFLGVPTATKKSENMEHVNSIPFTQSITQNVTPPIAKWETDKGQLKVEVSQEQGRDTSPNTVTTTNSSIVVSESSNEKCTECEVKQLILEGLQKDQQVLQQLLPAIDSSKPN